MTQAKPPTREVRTLIRDTSAVEIPAGTAVVLRTGVDVVIMQSLGGSYTVWTDRGMFRIDEGDADALGFDNVPKLSEVAPTGAPQSLEERIWSALRSCYDPEIPVNIVDLGLIYELSVTEDLITIKMTLTAPGCGMGDVLKTDVERKVRALPGVREVQVSLVFEPLWDQSRMSDAAKLELGYL